MYLVEFKRGGEEYKVECALERNYTHRDELNNLLYYDLYGRATLYKRVKGIFFRKWKIVAMADYDKSVGKHIKPTMDKFIEDYFERNKSENEGE